MTAAFLVCLLVPVGLGLGLGWLSARASGPLGVALLRGVAVQVLLLSALAIAGMPLSIAAWAVAGLAVIGLGVALPDLIRAGGATLPVHPIVLLAALIWAAIVVDGPQDYLIYAWDEWANWLGWARQLVVADRLGAPGIVVGSPGETPGWTLLLAFPAFLSGRFDPRTGVLMGAVCHLAVWAAVYDLLCDLVLRRLEVSRLAATAICWAFILLALAVEALWRLVPTLLLIEEPQAYFIVGVVALVLFALEGPRGLAATALDIGLVAAAAGLMKSAFVTFLPAYLLLAAALLVREHRRGGHHLAASAAVLLAPLGCALAGWQLIAVPSSCTAAGLGGMLSAVVAPHPVFGEAPLSYAARLLRGIGEFLVIWKLPLSLVAIAGVAALGVRRGAAVVALALVLYFAVHLIGIYAGMANCFAPADVAELTALQRYIRVPLRVIHAVGLIGLALAALHMAALRPSLERRLGRPALVAVLGAVCVVLLAWQAVQIRRSFADLARRPEISRGMYDMLQRVRVEAPMLAQALGSVSVADPVVLVIAKPPGTEAEAGAYEALGVRRGDRLREFRTVFISPDRLVVDGRPSSLLATANALWLFSGGDVVGRLIGPDIADAGCAEHPERYFLLRDAASNGWHCLKRPE